MKNHLYILLNAVPSKLKIRTIKLIRQHTLCGLMEAKQIVDSIPYVITLKEGRPFTWDEAREFYQELRELHDLTQETRCDVVCAGGDYLSCLVDEDVIEEEGNRYRVCGTWETYGTEGCTYHAGRLDCIAETAYKAQVKWLKWFKLSSQHNPIMQTFHASQNWELNNNAHRAGMVSQVSYNGEL